MENQYQSIKNDPGESQGRYYCPLHCEGDKIYDRPGNCPVCGMHLKKDETLSPPPKNATYTCPKHHRVRQNEPGSCLICGMDLVPEKPQI